MLGGRGVASIGSSKLIFSSFSPRMKASSSAYSSAVWTFFTAGMNVSSGGDRIHRDEPGDLLGMGLGVLEHDGAAGRLPDQHVRFGHVRGRRECVEVRHQLAHRTRRLRRRVAAADPGAVVGAHERPRRQQLLDGRELALVGADPALEHDCRGVALLAAAVSVQYPPVDASRHRARGGGPRRRCAERCLFFAAAATRRQSEDHRRAGRYGSAARTHMADPTPARPRRSTARTAPTAPRGRLRCRATRRAGSGSAAGGGPSRTRRWSASGSGAAPSHTIVSAPASRSRRIGRVTRAEDRHRSSARPSCRPSPGASRAPRCRVQALGPLLGDHHLGPLGARVEQLRAVLVALGHQIAAVQRLRVHPAGADVDHALRASARTAGSARTARGRGWRSTARRRRRSASRSAGITPALLTSTSSRSTSQRLERGDAADVAGDPARVAADRARRVVRALLVAADGEHRRPEPREALPGREPDPGRGAGDQHDLPVHPRRIRGPARQPLADRQPDLPYPGRWCDRGPCRRRSSCLGYEPRVARINAVPVPANCASKGGEVDHERASWAR